MVSGREVGAGEGKAKEWWGTPASQSLRDPSHEPERIVEPLGEKATELMLSLCASCFSLTGSSEAEGGGSKAGVVSRGREVGAGGGEAAERWDTPACQSLRDLSYEPEAIVEPSGEKATEEMPLCAFCFSVTRSSEAEGRGKQSGRGELWAGMGAGEARQKSAGAHLHPRA